MRTDSQYNPRPNLENIIIYDTTLRDGEQAPGVRFNTKQKIEIAKKLDELNIPEIEAGFPIVSKDEKNSVKQIANEGLNPRILALSRIKKGDMDAVIDCDTDGIILFASISPLHLKYKMHMNPEKVTELSVESVEYAKSHGLFIAFSAEDATRTDLKSLINLYKNVEKAGASRIHIADTIGVATPKAMEFIVKGTKRHLNPKTQLCVHCHNDFGLATANSLQGLISGADVAAATVNGIGERAGNASLEELIMSLRILHGVNLNLNLKVLCELSKLVERYSGMKISPYKPIIGSNAFRHESGIHVAAVLENPLTYEPFLPEILGREREIVLGKHSGRKAVIAKMQELDKFCNREKIGHILEIVKNRNGFRKSLQKQ